MKKNKVLLEHCIKQAFPVFLFLKKGKKTPEKLPDSDLTVAAYSFPHTLVFPGYWPRGFAFPPQKDIWLWVY